MTERIERIESRFAKHQKWFADRLLNEISNISCNCVV